MKKYLTLICILAANSLMGQMLISDDDYLLLESLKINSPFSESTAGPKFAGIGTADKLSLRGITKVGKYWYFSIHDSTLNSSFWVRLKDSDKETALIKAEFFDDENKELEIATANYTSILALKERDALTGPVPSILSSKKSSSTSPRQAMDKMLSGMSDSQKTMMTMHLVANMAKTNMQNQQGQQGQQQGGNNNKGSSGSSSGNKNSSSGNKSSSGKSSGSKK